MTHPLGNRKTRLMQKAKSRHSQKQLDRSSSGLLQPIKP